MCTATHGECMTASACTIFITSLYVELQAVGSVPVALFQVSAWVNFIRGENLFYPACTGQYNGKQCNKKLSDQGNGW